MAAMPALRPLFCEERAPHRGSLIAVLAVFSHESHVGMRRAIRGSWWDSASARYAVHAACDEAAQRARPAGLQRADEPQAVDDA